MIKVYGSELCEDTMEAIKKLDAEGVAYEFVDITAAMENLAEFLKIRDKEELFLPVKERGGVGVPLFVLADGSKTFDVEEI